MHISVIIASSRPELLKKCLKGFQKQETDFQFEIIAAGNVGIEENVVAENIKLIEVQNTHPNIKRNTAISYAKANLIALMDDDAVPHVNWINVAVETSRQLNDSVLTGPEQPYESGSRFSKLSYQILSSQLSEFNKGHINSKHENVQWFDVPFCNCVFPKKMWEAAGGFDEKIPWHMDDFHFFFQYRNGTAFVNVPQLVISHNRYPDTLTKLMQYKWKLRKETGEKLFNYPEIYWAVIPVKLAAVFSFGALVLFGILFFVKPVLILLLAALYIISIFAVSIRQNGLSSLCNVFNGGIILGVVHLTSVLGLYFGYVSAAFNSIIFRKTND